MPASQSRPASGTAAKIGAGLFLLWGILHVWVGAEGTRLYLSGDAHALWNMVIGGPAAPRASFQFATDPATIRAQRQLIENFVIDVAGYGLLGFVVAAGIWLRGSWTAYWIGVVIIGVADLTFLFALVLSGVIEFSAASLGGPIIWFLACAITPFGLPSIKKDSRT